MFNQESKITFYETIGVAEWMFTVHITKVSPTEPAEVHAMNSLFMLIREGLDPATKSAGLEWSTNTVWFQFSGSKQRENIAVEESERMYKHVVRSAARFGITSVPRVVM